MPLSLQSAFYVILNAPSVDRTCEASSYFIGCPYFLIIPQQHKQAYFDTQSLETLCIFVGGDRNEQSGFVFPLVVCLP